MIILVTGTPGAGKSLLAVSTLLPGYIGQKLVEENGETFDRRVLVDGVKNLLLPHELMAPTKTNFEGDILPEQEGDGLHNWYGWCKPGDVLFIDEIQRYWRPRGNGSKVPRMIAELETHRHKGVDFIIVTQHPMLIDQNVRRLVGRHIHVRRMWGGARAVRYEWDHCSSPDKVGDATKSYWPYPKDAFKFYKSAEVHTKQGGRPPLALAAVGLAMVALPVVAYAAVTRVQDMLNPAKAPTEATQNLTASLTPPTAKATVQPAQPDDSVAASSAPVVTVETAPVPEFAGCIASATRCVCFDPQGARVTVPDAACRLGSHSVQRVSFSIATTVPPSIESINPVSVAAAPGQPNKP